MLNSEKAQLVLSFAGLGVYILAFSKNNVCDFKMTEIMSRTQAFFLLWLGVISIIVSVVLTIIYLAKKNKNKSYKIYFICRFIHSVLIQNLCKPKTEYH